MLNTGKLSARLEKKINSCLVGKGAGEVHIHVPLFPDMVAPLVDGDPANAMGPEKCCYTRSWR